MKVLLGAWVPACAARHVLVPLGKVFRTQTPLANFWNPSLKMESIQGTLVASTTKLSVNRAGNSHQHLVQDAARPLATPTEMPLSETSIQVLLSILHGITELTISGDVITLAIYKAKDRCIEAGVSEEEFSLVIQRFLAYSKNIRKNTPYAF